MELKGSNLNRSLQSIVECDYVGILKVKNKDIGIKGDSKQVDTIFVSLKVLNEWDRHKVLFGRMEPDTRYCLALTVFLFKVSSGHHVNVGVLTTSSCVFIAQHFKIVLENIDDLIWL